MYKQQKVMLTHANGEELFTATVLETVYGQTEVGGELTPNYRVKLTDGKTVIVEPERMVAIH
jgi:hypothetical protein